jgi:hypothetical protein
VPPAPFAKISGTVRPVLSIAVPEEPALFRNPRVACSTESALSRAESDICLADSRGGSAFLDLRLGADLYFSGLVEPVQFQKLCIALTDSNLHLGIPER